MNVPTTVVIIAVLAGVGAEPQRGAQTIAEFARQVRIDRESGGVVTGRVFTSEDVLRAPTPGVVGRIEEVSDDAAASSSEASESGEQASTGDIPDPQEALAVQARVVQLLEDQEVQLRLELNRVRGQYTAPVASQQDLNAALTAIDGVNSNLEALVVTLSDAREVLTVLEEAAAEDAAASAPSQN